MSDSPLRLHAAASALHEPVLAWYAANARTLPWREPDAGAWAVMVSEFMLQQTPVARVLPAYEVWMRRWPKPADLAAEAPGEAVRAWDRLGYPRRALRLHAAAKAIVEQHGGVVPEDHAALLALPGVGTYTAAAIASFAYGQRHAVVDTNVRRVFARALTGAAQPSISPTAADLRLAESALPSDDVDGRPLGSRDDGARRTRLHCAHATLRRLPDPQPLRLGTGRQSAVRRSAAQGPDLRGHRPPGTRPPARRTAAAHGPVAKSELDACWPEQLQRERALDGLVADGLVDPVANDRYRLPA